MLKLSHDTSFCVVWFHLLVLHGMIPRHSESISIPGEPEAYHPKYELRSIAKNMIHALWEKTHVSNLH